MIRGIRTSERDHGDLEKQAESISVRLLGREGGQTFAHRLYIHYPCSGHFPVRCRQCQEGDLCVIKLVSALNRDTTGVRVEEVKRSTRIRAARRTREWCAYNGDSSLRVVDKVEGIEGPKTRPDNI